MNKLSQEEVARIVASSRLDSRSQLRAMEQKSLMRTLARAGQTQTTESLRSAFSQEAAQAWKLAGREYRSAFRKLVNGQNMQPGIEAAHRKMVERSNAARALFDRKNKFLGSTGYSWEPVADIYWSSGVEVVSSGNQAWHNYVDFTVLPEDGGWWGTEDQWVAFSFHWPVPGPDTVIADIVSTMTFDGQMVAWASGGDYNQTTGWFFDENYAELQASLRMYVTWDGNSPPQQSGQIAQIADVWASVSGFFQPTAEEIQPFYDKTYFVQYENLTIPRVPAGFLWVIVVLDLNSYNSFMSVDDASTGVFGHNFNGPFHVECIGVTFDVTNSEL